MGSSKSQATCAPFLNEVAGQFKNCRFGDYTDLQEGGCSAGSGAAIGRYVVDVGDGLFRHHFRVLFEEGHSPNSVAAEGSSLKTRDTPVI